MSKDETGEFYFMTAGGKATKPSVKNPSRHSIKRNLTKPAYESLRLAKAEARLAKRKLTVNWVVNEQTLPPFEHRLKIMKKSGKVLATFSAVKSHGRSAVINLPESLDDGPLKAELVYLDILGNQAEKMVLEVRR